MPNLNPLRGPSRRTPPADPKAPPKIEVKWDSARTYSYRADLKPESEQSLYGHPKGWNLEPDDKARPATAGKVERRDAGKDITLDINRDKTPLSHLIMEVGPGVVQGQLSHKPVLTRPPTRLEKQVMDDFGAAIGEFTRKSDNKPGTMHGEFIATYSKSKDLETGAVNLDRIAFDFRAANSIPVPETAIRPDYVIHSHPYDPKHPFKAGPTEELGGNFPSGADRHLARASEDGRPPPKQMLMHGGKYYLIHEGDLHFTLLDPKAKGDTWAAHPRQGDGWDKDLFLLPHPTPPPQGRAPEA